MTQTLSKLAAPHRVDAIARVYLARLIPDDVVMSVDVDQARALALDLPGVSEAPHFHRSAFRTPKRIFATLDAAAGDLNLMFDPDHRDFYCESEAGAFSPVSGGWGRRGATRCLLSAVSEPTLKSALAAAHQLAAPTPKRPKTPKTPRGTYGIVGG